MAAVCRIRTVLRKAAALQRANPAVFQNTPRCSRILIYNRTYHSFNFSNSLEIVRPAVAVTCPVRHYSELPPMTFEQLKTRIIYVLKLFDKVDPEKVTVDSRFIDDLGLDSLDVVEIIMAVEDEFGVEINDDEAEKVHNVKDVVELLADKMDVVE